MGQTFSVFGGQPAFFIGQTWVNPSAHFIALLCIGQLQSQSHWDPPSGQSHRHEHFISPPGPGPDPGPVGAGPEPDPFPGGFVTDPDPFPGGFVPDPFPGGVVPDPFPGGFVPDPFPGGVVPDPFPCGVVPDPFPGGVVPDPDPDGASVPACPPIVAVVPIVVAASVVARETEPFNSFAAPFFTDMSNVKTPLGPSKETLFATPLHFLSQAAFDLGLSLVPAGIRLRLQVQVSLPTLIFSFLKTSAEIVDDRTSTMAAILISKIARLLLHFLKE